jgi:hypothetical protein
MAAEDFFTRWSKIKDVPQDQSLQAEEVAAVSSPQELVPQALPQMEDVDKLHDESDFSVFMNEGVDETVKRSAMKKLFSNPHFNVMDGLDIYISDYSLADPLPPGMLASLLHAETLLNPLRHLEHPLQRLLQPAADAAADADKVLIGSRDDTAVPAESSVEPSVKPSDTVCETVANDTKIDMLEEMEKLEQSESSEMIEKTDLINQIEKIEQTEEISSRAINNKDLI